MEEIIELKAKAYDLYVSLEDYQKQVNEYVKNVITPVKEELIKVTNQIHEKIRSSSTPVQEQSGENAEVVD